MDGINRDSSPKYWKTWLLLWASLHYDVFDSATLWLLSAEIVRQRLDVKQIVQLSVCYYATYTKMESPIAIQLFFLYTFLLLKFLVVNLDGQFVVINSDSDVDRSSATLFFFGLHTPRATFQQGSKMVNSFHPMICYHSLEPNPLARENEWLTM